MLIERLAIIGVGLIGGSLARALRERGQVQEVVGFGRSLGNLQKAVELGVIDSAAVSVADAAHNADMIVVAVPVGSMEDIFSQLAPVLSEDAVVTDVGSVKRAVIDAAFRAGSSDRRCGAFRGDGVEGWVVRAASRDLDARGGDRRRRGRASAGHVAGDRGPGDDAPG
jgi:prephenate dehydrogenase